jgi:hypothetical protein
MRGILIGERNNDNGNDEASPKFAIYIYLPMHGEYEFS